jgi:hypothetical protein
MKKARVFSNRPKVDVKALTGMAAQQSSYISQAH